MSIHQCVIRTLLKGTVPRRLGRLVEACGGNRKAIRVAMNRLVALGLVEVLESRRDREGKEVLYRVSDRKGLRAELGMKLRENTEWDRLWKAVRVMRTFTPEELADVTGASIENVRSFAYKYRKAGYLRNTRSGGSSLWRLVKDTGPRRPEYRDQKEETIEKGNL